MPKRTDIQSVLILGAGPIVIGQACEFDYSGTQACKALREEGYRVILVNSNPATIMTDTETADAIYIEPITWQCVENIIAKEKPDAVLPTMGGQTALNCALDLAREGVLEKYNVELIGANQEAIDKAEDREKFRTAMQKIGLDMPRSAIAHSLEEALQVQPSLGFPTIIRPSFTMGGSGGGIAYNREEFVEICQRGLELSPTSELLLDESVLGWKEFEMEVVRDKNDNCIIVCSIENFDPMGVHTGDSITVAPAQTLTDKEYQRLRNMSIAVLREIGVETGGSNVQFGIDPETGRVVIIEMNPRVSRSSALASKATGFPIAKIAAKLAVGYTLDELQNDITGGRTPASFEPTIDYVVTKIPRFNFEKFPGCDPRLTTQMKSVGEVMAMGRTFQSSLQKAIRGLESGYCGLNPLLTVQDEDSRLAIKDKLRNPSAERLWHIADAMRAGFPIQEIQQLTGVDPWFLAQIEALIDVERSVSQVTLDELDNTAMLTLKQQGFADKRLAQLLECSEEMVRAHRHQLNLHPRYKRVDTCAAEFSVDTAYLYSTYDEECEARASDNKKIMVLGGGPNRIGQGIEFDYCCVQAALALREDGYETIMVNCNPETVSTDYDSVDRLYFEAVTLEDVLEIVDLENPIGVIIHFGGQTPLKIARALEEAGVPIIGTSPDSIDKAENRERFQAMLTELNIKQPPCGTVINNNEAIDVANDIGYPLLVRPSYVLGGRAMEIVHNEDELLNYMQNAIVVSDGAPVLLDRFLEDAIEVDIDAVCDGTDVYVGGIMEHIEQAGVHSGDSSCSLPAFSLSAEIQDKLKLQMRDMALALGVVGSVNAQFAIQRHGVHQSDADIFVIEVNPRASRTVPFVSKATGVPLAKVAARCMVGQTLKEQRLTDTVMPSYYSVKSPVFPFAKFPGADPILSPEMRSTGESMGVGSTFTEAYVKAHVQGQHDFDGPKCAFLSVRAVDKPRVIEIAKKLIQLDYRIVATHGTAAVLQATGVPCERVNKVREGRPHIVDMIKNEDIGFIVNTVSGQRSITDSCAIRRTALQHKVYYTTTIAGGLAAVAAMRAERHFETNRLQDLHARLTD